MQASARSHRIDSVPPPSIGTAGRQARESLRLTRLTLICARVEVPSFQAPKKHQIPMEWGNRPRPKPSTIPSPGFYLVQITDRTETDTPRAADNDVDGTRSTDSLSASLFPWCPYGVTMDREAPLM